MDTPYVTRLEDRVHSTQDYAGREFTARGDGTPVLAIAAVQDAGRGRSGHEWWTAPRAMLASLASASPAPAHLTLVPLLAGIAAHDAIADEIGIVTELKWPNDIMFDGRKVGGILSEVRHGAVIVGCGLNLWWPEPPDGVAGLLGADPGAELPVAIAHQWARRLIAGLDALPGSFERTRYVELCGTVGSDITWEPEGKGRAIGIEPDGALLVSTTAGLSTLRSNEVSHVRRATIPRNRQQS